MNDSREEPQGMTLTPAEAMALARRIVILKIAFHEDWLLWEDYPQLGEHAFARLGRALDQTVLAFQEQGYRLDQSGDVDSCDLQERASA